MNVNSAHPGIPGPLHFPENPVDEARELILADDTDELARLAEMLEQGVVTANTPSGENGETLLIYAVRQRALFSFVDMAGHPGAGDLNAADWNGNSAWHAIALHVDNEDFERWLDELGWLLEDNNLQIDWGLLNMNNETPLEVAQHLNKNLIADWITRQMEHSAHPPMHID